jgi:hypothetical protein
MRPLFVAIALALAATSSTAQLPDSPEARPAHVKRLVAANLAMYGATVFHAFGRRTEVADCINESNGLQNGLYVSGAYAGRHPATQKNFYSIALPIDSAVTVFSLVAHRKGWHGLEMVGPFSAASAHIAAGTMKYANGCY